MDVPPVAGIDELESHLQQLIETPETLLKSKLFDDVELQLTEANTLPLIPRILPSLITILTTTPHQPDQVVSLAIRLVRPVTFTQAMTLATEESLVLALQSPAPSAVLLALAVIQKASRTPSEAAIFSNMQSLVTQLFITWLSSPSVEVGESATRALNSLFETDCAAPSASNATLNLTMNGNNVTLRPQTGQGLFWRRIFDGTVNYLTIFDLCGAHIAADSIGSRLDERQRSLAQARLLRLLPHLAVLDLSTLAQSRSAKVETTAGVVNPAGQGLLYFATISMVDKTDLLMHITLLDFIRELLETLSMADLDRSGLDYLKLVLNDAIDGDQAVSDLITELKQSPGTDEQLLDFLTKLQLG